MLTLFRLFLLVGGWHPQHGAAALIVFEWLKFAEAMRAFVSHRLGGGEDLYTRLERVETDLTVARKVVVEGAKALKLAE